MKAPSLSEVVFALIYLSNYAFCQAPDTLWTRTYGGPADENAYSICFNGPYGYALAGYTGSFGAGNLDIYLILTSPFGDTILTRTYGSTTEDGGCYISRTTDNGFILTGYTGSYPTETSLIMIKTNNVGDVDWTKIYTPDFWTMGCCVQQTSDGGYIVSGRKGNIDGHFLIKTDSNGDSLWTNVYPVSYNAYAEAVIQTSDGGYIITGCSGAGTYETSWNVDFLKINSQGRWQWTKVYGDTSFGYDDAAYSVEQTPDGGYIIAAFTMTYGAGGYDAWLIKTDENGDTIWTKTFGGEFDDRGLCAIQTGDGGYVMTGLTESFGAGGRDVYVVRTDSNGNTLWTKTIGGPNNDIGDQILVTDKGEYVIVGYTQSFGAGGRDVYLIKLASDRVDIDNENNYSVPFDFALQQNRPNPFNASTVIKYELPQQSQITIEIYDILGRKVTTLIDKQQSAGYHQVNWQVDDFASGLYFYKLQAGDYNETKKMILIK